MGTNDKEKKSKLSTAGAGVKEKETKQSTVGAENKESKTREALREKGLTFRKTKHGGQPYQLRGRGRWPIHGYVFTRDRRMKRSLKFTTLKRHTF